MGWGWLRDRTLVERLRGHCEAFLTIDQGFEYEHNLSSLNFGIVIVHVVRNRITSYKALQERMRQAVSSVRPGK
jgi:hypothetical protein